MNEDFNDFETPEALEELKELEDFRKAERNGELEIKSTLHTCPYLAEEVFATYCGHEACPERKGLFCTDPDIMPLCGTTASDRPIGFTTACLRETGESMESYYPRFAKTLRTCALIHEEDLPWVAKKLFEEYEKVPVSKEARKPHLANMAHGIQF